ncbi:hypothetical protein FI667_g4912, partial [Globisporangium splendens]
MWKLLEQAAKSASANASEYVITVQEKAQSIVATVQDEAATILHALGTTRTGPVDEILYEEIDDYKAFLEGFEIGEHTDAISKVLETDEEIHDLHEQMVPLQLSYEEFWSRYFFRLHQEEEQKRREEERKQQQREQQEAAKAAREAELDEFDEEDDDLVQADAVDDSADESGAQFVGETRNDADHKAMLAWKKKAAELQKKLGAMAAQHEQEKLQLQEEKDMQYQNLCDMYEAKMTEVTMQIDDARAIGYDAGIQESETIIATMRQAADEEIERLTQQLVRIQQEQGLPGGAEIEPGTGLGDPDSVYQLKAALSLKSQTLATVSAEKVAVETLLLSKDEELAALTAQLEETKSNLQHSGQNIDSSAELNALKQANEDLMQANSQMKQQLEAAKAQLLAYQSSTAPSAPPDSQANAAEETRKEIELWRIRALKMKKAKELIEAELQALKSQNAQSIPEREQELLAKIAALEQQRDHLLTEVKASFTNGVAEGEAKNRTQIDELTQKCADAATKLVAAEEDGYQRGLAAGKSESEAQLRRLQEEAARGYDAGYEASAVVSQKEIDLLRTEIAVLRAGTAATEMTDSEAEPDIIWGDPVPVLGEEFSDTDAVSASIDNLPRDTTAANWDLKSPASEDAPRDDWGEW